MILFYLLLTATVLALLLTAWPSWGLMAWLRRRRRARWQRQVEDVLKHLLSASYDARPMSPAALAGAARLSTPTMLPLLEQMSRHDLVQFQGEWVLLTATGRKRALHVLRAHRLYERYLADEAGLAINQLHRDAERIEHELSPSEVDQLNEALGYPRVDPHGDPIPDAAGQLERQPRTVLGAWPLDRPGVVAHVEDEPPGALRQLLATGLKPGALVRVRAADAQGLDLLVDGQPARLSGALALGVHVTALPPAGLHSATATEPAAGATIALSALPLGAAATVLALAPGCRGLTRRRLLDLGLTPGAVVQAELANVGRSATAYRIRGTLIALRQTQARAVRVQPMIPATTPGAPA